MTSQEDNEEVRAFIERELPSLAPFVAGLAGTRGDYFGGSYVGFASHPARFNAMHCFMPAALEEPVPAHFVAVAVFTKGGNEELVVHLTAGHRIFWFRARYMTPFSFDVESVRSRLAEALARWKAEEEDVIVDTGEDWDM